MLSLKFALRTLFKTPFVTIVAIVALGAGFIPAVRASHVEPMQALRYE